LGDKGEPTLDIEVLGAFNQPASFTCLIDTGFTGFLSIPLLQAFPVGLVLSGTMSLELANGAVETKLTCLGIARLNGVELAGVIVIENESNQVLLGMDFLRIFGLKLLVCPTTGQIEVVPATDAFTVAAAAASRPLLPLDIPEDRAATSVPPSSN